VPKREEQAEQALPSLALVFGYIAVKDLGSERDQVDVLARLGYGNHAIARICGKTPSTVAVMKSRLKKEQGRRRR